MHLLLYFLVLSAIPSLALGIVHQKQSLNEFGVKRYKTIGNKNSSNLQKEKPINQQVLPGRLSSPTSNGKHVSNDIGSYGSLYYYTLIK